jgi:hypothetical protein
MWVMIEYGLDVRITENTWNWIKVFLKIESSDETQGETGPKTPHTSTNTRSIGKRSDEKHTENVENLPIGQSKQKQGSKKRSAGKRRWKWLRTREVGEAQRQDEETGMENEKSPARGTVEACI